MLVRDRFELTRQTLDSLGDAGNVQKMIITVLDDRSLTPTREFVECWCSDHGANYIRNDIPFGTGTLRNAVIESARYGHYVYLSDNDLFFTPSWLDMLIERYEYAWTYGYRVIGAYNHPFNQPISRIDRVYEVNHLASQSMLIRWDVWNKFGPFVDTPVDKVCQSEDVVFSNKIREAGYKVGVVSPWLVANTGITNSFGEHIPGWELAKSQCPVGVLCE